MRGFAAQLQVELILALRRGESLLITLVVPVVLLVQIAPALRPAVPVLLPLLTSDNSYLRYAAAFMLGAAGVQIGSAYLHCPESKISAPHREALQRSTDDGTVLTNVITGRPARGIRNRVIRDSGRACTGRNSRNARRSSASSRPL